jgi:transposase-like protein
MEKRNHYTAEFKAKVVLELLGEESTLNQVATKYQLNPQMLSKWKSDFVKKQARGAKAPPSQRYRVPPDFCRIQANGTI